MHRIRVGGLVCIITCRKSAVFHKPTEFLRDLNVYPLPDCDVLFPPVWMLQRKKHVLVHPLGPDEQIERLWRTSAESAAGFTGVIQTCEC